MDVTSGYSPFVGSPVFAMHIQYGTGTDFNTVWCIGTSAATGGAISYTFNHCGFKSIRSASGNTVLYATQADGTTENASSALDTVTGNPNGTDQDIILKVNSTTSVDYYSRKNGGALSSATNLTSNMPVANVNSLSFQVSNVTVATNATMTLFSASYER